MDKNKNTKYVGWVPCLNGELVFDLVECGLKTKAHDSISVIYYGKDLNGEPIEHILIYSVVDWKDFGDQHDNGLWSVVLITKRSLKNNSHIGSVFLRIHNQQHTSEWDDVISRIRQIARASKMHDVPELKEEFEGLNITLDKVVTSDCFCYKTAFNLEQNGVVTLDYHYKNKESDASDAKIITRQAYYYIKYSWHRHQHHDNRAETLTTCHEINSDNTDGDIALRLIGDLKRNLVRFKRSVDHSSHREVLKATGIVSYTKALVEIMKSKKFIDDDVYSKEMNHLDYFQESLGTISSTIEKDIAMHNRAVNDARAIILFIFAIMTPALVINREGISNKFNSIEVPFYVDFVGQLYSSQSKFFIFLIFIITVLGALISIQTRYGNTWIFWKCFTKPVTFFIKDQSPDSSISKTNIISIMIMLFGMALIIGFFVHLVIYDSVLFQF